MTHSTSGLEGRTLGFRFRLDEDLGEGIYRGEDTQSGQAIFARVAAGEGAEQLDMLGEALSAVDAEGLIPVLGFGRDAELSYLALDQAQGVPLADLCDREGQPAARLVWIASQASRALAGLHARGFAHNAVDPQNVLIDPTRQDLVTIIGYERVRRVGEPGEPPPEVQFASIEALTGAPVDGRSDVFSLGCTLYLLRCGRLPWPELDAPGVSVEAAARALAESASTPVPKAEGSDAVVDALIMSTLAFDAQDRPTMLELADAWAELCAQRPWDASQAPPIADRGTLLQTGLPAATMEPAEGVHEVAVRAGPRGPSAASIAAADPTTPIKMPRGRRLRLDVLFAAGALGLAGFAFWHVDPLGWWTPAADPAPSAPQLALPMSDPVPRIKYTLASVPPGARVTHDGIWLGTTPLNFEWPQGRELAVQMYLRGYEPRVARFKGDGERARHVVRLTPLGAGRDWLKISSKPVGAAVHQGDEFIGTTPFEWRPLGGLGQAKLRVEKIGFATVIYPVDLQVSDAPRSLDIPLVAAVGPKLIIPKPVRPKRRR